MEGRKWEEMNEDCLVNIFGRVGIESLLLDIPYVCKPWCKATLDPLCWQKILFPYIYYYGCFKSRLQKEYDLCDESSITSFIKFVVKRADGYVTDLALPGSCTKEALLYAADACPQLRFLELRCNLLRDHLPVILAIVSKWKNLEFLRLGETSCIQEIMGEVVNHCKNFTGLAVTEGNIGVAEASAIVILMPKIEYLDLRWANIEQENLAKILQGCGELKYLDVRNCVGFDEDDEEIIKLGSHIRKFMREGSCSLDILDGFIYDDCLSD